MLSGVRFVVASRDLETTVISIFSSGPMLRVPSVPTYFEIYSSPSRRDRTPSRATPVPVSKMATTTASSVPWVEK